MNYHYLDVSLEFEKFRTNQVSTVAYFKKHVVQCIRKLFGETGSSITVDILKYEEDSRRAILRVPADHYVKLHSALTLCGDYEGVPCAYRIHKISDLLINLCGDSRTYNHC